MGRYYWRVTGMKGISQPKSRGDRLHFVLIYLFLMSVWPRPKKEWYRCSSQGPCYRSFVATYVPGLPRRRVASSSSCNPLHWHDASRKTGPGPGCSRLCTGRPMLVVDALAGPTLVDNGMRLGLSDAPLTGRGRDTLSTE